VRIGLPNSGAKDWTQCLEELGLYGYKGFQQLPGPFEAQMRHVPRSKVVVVTHVPGEKVAISQSPETPLPSSFNTCGARLNVAVAWLMRQGW
jgi:hypothetical protein